MHKFRKWILRNSKAIVVLFVVTILFLLYIYYILPWLQTEQFQQLVLQNQYQGYLIVILLNIVAEVFAPLPATPALIVSVSIYGWSISRHLFYISSAISAVINFYIARRWGRKLVLRIVGKKNMEKIDDIVVSDSTKSLILFRTIGYPIYDFVSYAFGLSKVQFRKYIAYTLILNFFVNYLYAEIFIRLGLSKNVELISYYVSMLLLFPLLSYYAIKIRNATKK